MWIKLATNSDRAQLVVMAEFAMNKSTDNQVSYDFWMTSSSNRALDFLEDFAPFQENLQEGDHVNFQPHYVFWECIGCEKRYLDNDCYGGGRYCAIEPTNDKIKGREIVLEDLRQKCLFNSLKESGNTTVWFDYLERVHATCYNTIDEFCSQKAHERLGLDWVLTQTCVTNSFSKGDWSSSSCRNTIIDAEIKLWKDYGTNVYPSVVINGKTYRGQIEPFSVFNAICASFQDPPKTCLRTLGKLNSKDLPPVSELIEETAVTVAEIVALIVGVVMLNVMVLYCCRRRVRRELS